MSKILFAVKSQSNSIKLAVKHNNVRPCLSSDSSAKSLQPQEPQPTESSLPNAVDFKYEYFKLLTDL